MTCICGHHEHAHAQDVGLCGSPHGCDCTKFRKPASNPEPFVDAAKATQDAEWFAGSEAADTAERNLARAYLVKCEQVATLTAERDAWEVACHNATIEKHEQVALLRAPVPSGVTEAMVTAGINALDDVSGDKGLSMGRRERVRAILTAALASLLESPDARTPTTETRARLAEAQQEATAARVSAHADKARHDCEEWHNEGIGCTHCHATLYPTTETPE